MAIFIDPDGLDWIPLLFLLAVYAYILFTASNMISDGSELLLLIKSVAGIVGSVVLPVLGAVPDGAIVLFSGLGPGAQQQLSVGVGALAGSTIMLLTLPWLLSVVAGRVDCDSTGNPGYHSPPRLAAANRWSLTTGVLATDAVKSSANIMMLTAVSFVIIQVPAFVENCSKTATEAECVKHKDVTKWFALIGLILCLGFFVWYLWKQVTGSQDKVAEAKREQRIEQAIVNNEVSVNAVFSHMIQTSLRSSSALLGARSDEKEMRRVLNHMFDRFDHNPKDQHLDKAELRSLVTTLHGTPFAEEDFEAWFQDLDTDQDGMVSRREFVIAMKRYLSQGGRRNSLTPVGADRMRSMNASSPNNGQATGGADVELASANALAHHASSHGAGAGPTVNTGDSDSSSEEEEEMPDDLKDLPHEEQMRKIKIRSCTLMFAGTALVLIFSDPMVDVLSALGTKMGVQPFYVSFVLAPLASNASELLASYNYALKKTRSSITISFSALLGAAIMNNTFCLGIFLALVFFQGLSWEFAAETIAIVVVEAFMFIIGRRVVHRVYHAVLVMALYPLSLVLVAVLENVVKLN